MSDANDRFEEKARKFYKETGMLPPGKDSALNDHTYEERQIAWEIWCRHQQRIAELEQQLESNN